MAGFRLAEESRRRTDSLDAAPVKAVNPLRRQEEDIREKGKQENKTEIKILQVSAGWGVEKTE